MSGDDDDDDISRGRAFIVVMTSLARYYGRVCGRFGKLHKLSSQAKSGKVCTRTTHTGTRMVGRRALVPTVIK